MTDLKKKEAPFSCGMSLQEGIPVIRVEGYFNEQAGALIHELAKPELTRGCKALIIDLAPCNLINSPGVVSMIELGISGSEHFDCRIIICGLDKVKENVFEVSGLFNFVDAARDLACALSLAKG